MSDRVPRSVIVLGVVACGVFMGLTGCRHLGNVFFPPHPDSGWDKGGEFEALLVDSYGARALAVEAGVPSSTADRFVQRKKPIHDFKTLSFPIIAAIEGAVKIVGAVVSEEATRYEVRSQTIGTVYLNDPVRCRRLQFLDEDASAVCAAKQLTSGVPAPADGDWGPLVAGDLPSSPRFIAIRRTASRKFYPWEEDKKQTDFLYLIQIIPDAKVNAMRLVPTLLRVNRTQAKVIALDGARPWSLINPLVWVYEALDLLPFWDWHAVKGKQTLRLQAFDETTDLQVREAGSVSFDLEEWSIRELPFTWIRKKSTKADGTPDKTSIPTTLPFFAWHPAIHPVALNVMLESSEENAFGDALTFIGKLLSDKSEDIAKGATNVLGIDDDADGNDAEPEES